MIDDKFNYLPSGIQFNFLLEKLREICWGSSDILKAYARGEKPPFGFPKALKIEESLDGPVSAADLAVNQWLIDGFEKSFPLAPWEVISEETSKSQLDLKFPIESEWFWLLDPLDGTKDFLQGTHNYAVHLALIKQNRPVLGVVLIPELDELWFGLIGYGAWCENRKRERMNVSFSDRNRLSLQYVVTSKSHRNQRLEKLISSLPVQEKNSFGSVGCKIASILRGENDFYISLSGTTAPKDWDIAAPEAILIAAGGMFSRVDKSTLFYNRNDFSQHGCLVASHGNNHNEICNFLFNSLEKLDF